MTEAPTFPTDGMTDDFELRFYETLARIERDLSQLKDGLGLLGIKPCSQCRKFFRSSEAGALFDAGELICLACIPEWWRHRSTQLTVKDREEIESKMVYWLREYHHAEVIKAPNKLPAALLQQFQIVATCLECHGTGVLMGNEHCHYCDRRGTVWVVVPKKA